MTDTTNAEERMKDIMRSLLPRIDGMEDVLDAGLPQAFVRATARGGTLPTFDALYLTVLFVCACLSAMEDDPVDTAAELAASAFSEDRTKPVLRLLVSRIQDAMEADDG